MKKLFGLVACTIVLSFSALANSPFDEEENIESEFAALDEIQNYLEANPEVDFATLEQENKDLLSGVNLTNSTSSLTATDQMPLLPAFWWGCCLGIIGLALVYFITDNDRDQVKKALIGCVISTVIAGVGGLLGAFSWF